MADRILVTGLALFDSLFHGIHLLEKGLGGLDGRQIIGRLGLVDAEGIAQQVHAGLHVIVGTIANFRTLAIGILLGTLSVDILTTGFDDDQAVGVEKVLNGRRSHVSLDDLGANLEKVMDAGFDAAVITSLGDGDGTIILLLLYNIYIFS
jgi:hypothetical protein